MSKFSLVKERLANASGIAWDTCHKIYVLMDSEQVDQMREYGYEEIITDDQQTPKEMLETIKDWYDNSCGLQFVQSVTTDHDDPNEGFETLIAQGEE